MKKLVLTSIAIFAGAMLVHAQGYVALTATVKGTVQTNGTSIGEGSGSASASIGGAYDVEILDMTSNSWASLSPSQQAGADNLLQNPSDVSLWTDSGLSGTTAQGTTAGEVSVATGGGSGATAANWSSPTGSSYNTAANADYYLIVGWSANEGLSWTQVASALNSGLPVSGANGGWFGETVVAWNYAGNPGNSLNAVNAWSGSGATSTTGTGLPNGDAAGDLVLLPVTTVPEPASLVLAGLGGISMLLLRRRKS